MNRNAAAMGGLRSGGDMRKVSEIAEATAKQSLRAHQDSISEQEEMFDEFSESLKRLITEKEDTSRVVQTLISAMAVYAREKIDIEFEDDMEVVEYFMDFFEENDK